MDSHFEPKLLRNKLQEIIGPNFQDVIIKSKVVKENSFRKWVGSSPYRNGPRAEGQKMLSDFILANYNVKLDWRKFYVADEPAPLSAASESYEELQKNYEELLAENNRLRQDLEERNRFFDMLRTFLNTDSEIRKK